MIDPTLCAAIIFSLTGPNPPGKLTLFQIQNTYEEAQDKPESTLLASGIAAALGNCDPPQLYPSQCNMLKQQAGSAYTRTVPEVIPGNPTALERMNLTHKLGQMTGQCEQP